MHEREIILAEQKWLSLVKDYIGKISACHWMPSHDLGHHLRVWNNASTLLRNIKIIEPYFVEKLFLACLFHDTGLTITNSNSHGLESRQACEQFLLTHSGMVLFETDSLLEAIEKHDDKEYSTQQSILKKTILNVLSVADDLDAFGALGAYRYMEIYLLRGIKKDITNQIRVNASKRYAHCLKFMKELVLSTLSMEKKYECLVQLFSEETFIEPTATLVTWIEEGIVIPKVDPYSFFNQSGNEGNLGDRSEFFRARFIDEIAYS
jgi:HD superfamily phosphodiesterase